MKYNLKDVRICLGSWLTYGMWKVSCPNIAPKVGDNSILANSTKKKGQKRHFKAYIDNLSFRASNLGGGASPPPVARPCTYSLHTFPSLNFVRCQNGLVVCKIFMCGESLFWFLTLLHCIAYTHIRNECVEKLWIEWNLIFMYKVQLPCHNK